MDGLQKWTVFKSWPSAKLDGPEVENWTISNKTDPSRTTSDRLLVWSEIPYFQSGSILKYSFMSGSGSGSSSWFPGHVWSWDDKILLVLKIHDHD